MWAGHLSDILIRSISLSVDISTRNCDHSSLCSHDNQTLFRSDRFRICPGRWPKSASPCAAAHNYMMTKSSIVTCVSCVCTHFKQKTFTSIKHHRNSGLTYDKQMSWFSWVDFAPIFKPSGIQWYEISWSIILSVC